MNIMDTKKIDNTNYKFFNIYIYKMVFFQKSIFLNNYHQIANNGKTFNIKNFLFLINDSNEELKQHFTNTYISDITYNNIIDNLNYKNNFCKNLNVKYIFGINPDKSFCLKDIIKNDNDNNTIVNRFFVDILKKNKYDFEFIDFYNGFDGLNNLEDFFHKSDSHVNDTGRLLYVEYLKKILNINNNLKDDLIEKINYNFYGDLTSNTNYNILNVDKSRFVENVKILEINIKNFEFLNLPIVYNNTYRRNNIYVRNNYSVNKLKIIFLCDSTIFNNWRIYAYNFFETIFLWDHNFFPTDLINDIRPDYVIEIRTERFLNNYYNAPYENYIKKIYDKKYNTSDINAIPDNVIIQYYNAYYNYGLDYTYSDLDYIKKYLLY